MLENFGYFEYAIIAIAAIGSAVIKNGVGVGAGIFMLPFLALVLPAKFALGLGAPIMLVSDITGVVYYWKEWDKRELLLLLPPAVLGVILGASMIKLIPNELFRFWVGVFAIGFSSYQLLKLKQSRTEASGVMSNNALVGQVKGLVKEIYVIGDAAEPRNALFAVREGAEIGRKI